MHKKLFLVACIAFTSMGTQCLPISPTQARNGGPGMIGTPTSSDENSGIVGTTSSLVVSGVPGGPTTGGPTSVEFAIAPVQADKPIYEKAIFVKSDAQGMFKVELPPGT